MSATQRVRERCIAECLACTRLASECAHSCITGGQAESMSRCISLCVDCATVTSACATLAARDSEYTGQICGVCADLCNAYAAECEKHGDGIMV